MLTMSDRPRRVPKKLRCRNLPGIGGDAACRRCGKPYEPEVPTKAGGTRVAHRCPHCGGHVNVLTDAKQELVVRLTRQTFREHMKLVEWLMSSKRTPPGPLAPLVRKYGRIEVESEAMEALVEAAAAWVPERGAFSTYVGQHVVGRLRSWAAAQQTVERARGGGRGGFAEMGVRRVRRHLYVPSPADRAASAEAGGVELSPAGGLFAGLADAAAERDEA